MTRGRGRNGRTKHKLHETVQYPVEHANKYVKFGMSASKSIFFYGLPGCGNTLLARAITKECGDQSFSPNDSGSPKPTSGNCSTRPGRPRPAFSCSTRWISSPRAWVEERPGIVSSTKILTKIDGSGTRKNIFVIEATNGPSVLDPAVIRPGR